MGESGSVEHVLERLNPNVAFDPKSVVALLVPVGPSVDDYMKKGRGGRLYLTAESREYRESVWGCAMLQARHIPRPWFPEGDVTFTMHWFRATQRTPSGGEFYSGDVDNRLKPILDALQQIAYTNDAQVRRIEAEREDEIKIAGWPHGCYSLLIRRWMP